MKNIVLGMRPLERLTQIPPHLRPHHEFCFYLHDQLVEMLKQYEASGVSDWAANAIAKSAAEQGMGGGMDVLKLFDSFGLSETRKHLLISRLALALTSDLLHFVFEALCCLEKRKFTVALALMRKPFKENMLFLAWIVGDHEEFLRRFEGDTATTLNGISPARRREILGAAIQKLSTTEAFDADHLNELVFSKGMLNGFEPLWQKATHLITSRGENLKTEDLNINLIFNDVRSDYLYEAVYAKLPYLMLFVTQLVLRSFTEVAPNNKLTMSHLVLASMGAYECLSEIKSRPLTTGLVKRLRPFLRCLHCQNALRMSAKAAMTMYLLEKVECSSCHLWSDVPFYWLLAQAGITLEQTDSMSAFGRLMDELGIEHSETKF